MGNAKSTLEVTTAFTDCAKTCPDFAMDVTAAISGGGFYEFKTFNCRHRERCLQISKAYKKEEK